MPRFDDVSYGHRWLWVFFNPVLVLTGDGFQHRGRRYVWSDLRMIRLTQVPFPRRGAIPEVVYFGRADVHLSDGRAIRLRAEDVVKRGALVSRGFASAFDEVVALLQAKRRENLQATQAKGEASVAA